MTIFIKAVTVGLIFGCCLSASATVFRGINFADGERSFADAVLLYEPGFGGGLIPTSPAFGDPLSSLGTPDYPVSSDSSTTGSISLGNGGRIILEFKDNLLTTSGGSAEDLFIFEVGPRREGTFVSLRPTLNTLSRLDPAGDIDGDGFFEVGTADGGTGGIDIDAFFSGDLAFDAVQLIDDPNQGPTTGTSVGADIDAVGAFSSAVVPEPTTLIQVAGALILASVYRRGMPSAKR